MKRNIGWAVGAAVLIAMVVWVVRIVFEDPHVAKGRAIYAQYCTGCHGEKGQGNGFNARNLDPGPRDLTDRIEPYMGESTNEELFKGIREGIAGSFPKGPQTAGLNSESSQGTEEEEEGSTPLMPYWGYTLTDEEIWELVAFIRTLHKNDADPIVFKEKTGEEEEPTLSRPQPVRFPDPDSAEGRNMIKQGMDLYEVKYGCSGCHRIGEKGGQIGPDLSRAGFRMNAAWMYQWIQFPQGIRHEAKMPAFNMPEEEAKAIVMFLKTLRASASESQDPSSPKEKT